MSRIVTAGATKRVLVVDDEATIVDAVATALRYEGYEVETASNGNEAVEAVAAHTPSLVVLDLMLPDVQGIEVARRIRAQFPEIAILYLTARHATEDKVGALRAGGDDYVTKPFDLPEVVARVDAILRRAVGQQPGETLRVGDVVLDESRHEVSRGGVAIAVTATEFSLLRFFMLNPGAVLSKREILLSVWHYDFGGSTNVVETYVSYLRKKLDAHGPPLIKTVRQAGYMLEAPAEQEIEALAGTGRNGVVTGPARESRPPPSAPAVARRARFALPRLSLRTRLVLGMVLVAAVALVGAGRFRYVSLRSFLIARVDSTLEYNHRGIKNNPQAPGEGRAFDVDIQTRSIDGTKVLYDSGPPQIGARPAPPPPRLPATISLPSAQPGERDRLRYFTVPATSGGGRYRVRASIEGDSPQMLILATPLDSVDATLRRLLEIDTLALLAALGVIGLVGFLVMRVGLRPLNAIVRTADEISAGDLSSRVGRADSETEVGRLGLALNTMLARIEESDRRLRRFVADASHELRTPLATVRGYTALFGLGAAKRPDDLERLIFGIGSATERMGALVEDLLLLARLDEHGPLARKPVRLDKLAAEAVDTAHAIDPSHPIELATEPLVTLGDELRLRQVLDNLLGNARSHTPPGTPIRVRVSRDEDDALLEVADDGPGMSPDEASRAFERFYRTDASRARDSGGSGLGLSIVSAVTEAHGGSVSVESERGRGATFRVRLPLAP